VQGLAQMVSRGVTDLLPEIDPDTVLTVALERLVGLDPRS